MKLKTISTAVLSATMLLGAAGMAQADEFPTKPLTLVVGFGAGGSTDIQARVLANILEEELG